jgi:hypothetical protein
MPSTGRVCLIMQRMPGVPLDQLWPALDDFEQADLCTKLNGIIRSIRSIPVSPIPLYGTADQSPFHKHLFYSPDEDKEICGPFDSEDDFNAALMRRLRSIWANRKKHGFKADLYENKLGRTLVGRKAVFTHSNLQRKNVIVHRDALQE